jgi:hypothetical protein
MACMWLYLGQQ